ncbi:MAG: glycosyltransferase [Verrucomicrobiales bacterium]
MRLVYVTETLPYGAGEGFIYPELAWLRNAGHEILVIPAFPGGDLRNSQSSEVSEFTLKQTSSLKGVARLVSRPALFSILAAWISAAPSPRKLNKNIRMLARAAAVSDAVQQFAPTHIHAHWANYTSTLAHALSRFTRAPWSFTAHRYDIRFNNLLKQKSASASFVRFISKSGLTMATEIGLSPHAQTEIIRMGVDLPSTVAKPAANGQRFRLVCPASLIEIKGHKYLLQALSLLPPSMKDKVRLTLAGEGPLRPQLENMTEELGLSQQVKFSGQVKHGELLSWYAQGEVDCVVLPSLHLGYGQHEGIPVSLMEAMAHGLPVISTQTGGIGELVDDQVGFLVPGADAGALGQAIAQMGANREAQRDLGRAARERIENNFSIQKSMKRLVERFQATAL